MLFFFPLITNQLLVPLESGILFLVIHSLTLFSFLALLSTALVNFQG